MKRTATVLALTAVLAAGTLAMAPMAHAQAVVIDPANLQQAIVRYTEMIQQLEQLKAQLEQAKQQYASLTGSRGLGAIDAENYSASIPTNWQQTLSAMQNGGNVGALAHQITSEASELHQPQFANVDATVTQALTTHLNDAATAQALNAQTYDDSGARFARLNQLMGQINSTTDMKSIGELQARIEIENGMLLNELIKLQSMNALIDNTRRVQQQHETQDDYKLTAAKY